MPYLEPGVPTFIFARLTEGFIAKNVIAIAALADVTVKAIQASARSGGSHALGTPTPASPGGPPAMISGTLANSIGRSPISRGSGGATCQIGMIAGNYPTYRSRKSSSQYAAILELVGCRNGATYPFLIQTATDTIEQMAEPIYTAAYGEGGWTRIM